MDGRLREQIRDELTIAAQTTYSDEPKIAEGIRIARSIVWNALDQEHREKYVPLWVDDLFSEFHFESHHRRSRT